MSDQFKALRKLAHKSKTDDMKEGRRNRAAVFTDKKKEASRRGCRGKSDGSHEK